MVTDDGDITTCRGNITIRNKTGRKPLNERRAGISPVFHSCYWHKLAVFPDWWWKFEVIEKLIYFGALKHVAILLVYLSLNTAQKCQYAHFLVQSAIIPPLPPPISVMSHLHHQTHPPSLTSSNYTLPVVFFPPSPMLPSFRGMPGASWWQSGWVWGTTWTCLTPWSNRS